MPLTIDFSKHSTLDDIKTEVHAFRWVFLARISD
jgi:hypothetical protein